MQLSDETLPQIAINPYYLSLMKQKDTETEAKDYIEGKIRQAEWVCQCIGQRNQHIVAAGRRDFVRTGEFLQKDVENWLRGRRNRRLNRWGQRADAEPDSA